MPSDKSVRLHDVSSANWQLDLTMLSSVDIAATTVIALAASMFVVHLLTTHSSVHRA
jgi:hypothetical protein